MLKSVKPEFSCLQNRLRSVTSATFGYLIISATFSLLIFLRLNLSSNVWIKEINVAFYFIMYFIVPFIAVAYSLTTVINYTKKQIKYKRSLRIYLGYLALVSAVIFFIVVSLSSNGISSYEWILLVFPVFLAYTAYLSVSPNTLLKKRKQLIGLMLLISTVLPLATAFLSQEIVLSRVANTSDQNQKVQVIGDLTRNNLGTYSFFRSGGDYWKYLMVGTGACFEAAMASTKLLIESGFNARIICLPGEDHAFVEVEIDKKWMVIDPGYGYTTPTSRQQRADARLAEMGAISYVIALSSSGSNFTELTSFYVPTDTITIKVTDKGAPLPNAQIYFTHEFRNRTQKIPDSNLSFHTDSTGEISFRLGALTYNENANRYEDFYFIFVNGQNKGNITSAGKGAQQVIEIDMDLNRR